MDTRFIAAFGFSILCRSGARLVKKASEKIRENQEKPYISKKSYIHFSKTLSFETYWVCQTTGLFISESNWTHIYEMWNN